MKMILNGLERCAEYLHHREHELVIFYRGEIITHRYKHYHEATKTFLDVYDIHNPDFEINMIFTFLGYDVGRRKIISAPELSALMKDDI